MKIVVTGGASGVGLAITERLQLDKSNQVLISYSSSVAKSIELQKHENVDCIQCDFSDSDSVKRFCDRIEDFDADAIVNNAFGGFEKKHFHKLNVNDFHEGFLNNILPLIAIMQVVVKGFRKKKRGRIITILSSSLINVPPIGWSQYVASKAYIHSLSKSWASEYAKFNVTSNCISPSFMLTSMNSEVDVRMVEMIRNSTPTGNLIEVESVAESVSFLLGSSGQINGANLVVNQGESIIS